MFPQERQFVQTVMKYYKVHGRHDLPWRHTSDPYRIAVSELMLQQTQVARVLPKYQAFIKAFPTVRALARASLRDVLHLWSGLGYNRRAKFLYNMAQVVVEKYKGTFPETIEGLEKLPGIGPYTAGAIYAFAYNKAWPVIETNIRTVYIHHFFKDKEGVSDKQLMPIIKRTMRKTNPRQWYWALMDYGTYLKSIGIKNNAQSAHYTKQTVFKGSLREVRGAVLKTLVGGSLPEAKLLAKVPRAHEVLPTLIAEGLVHKRGKSYAL